MVLDIRKKNLVEKFSVQNTNFIAKAGFYILWCISIPFILLIWKFTWTHKLNQIYEIKMTWKKFLISLQELLNYIIMLSIYIYVM